MPITAKLSKKFYRRWSLPAHDSRQRIVVTVLLAATAACRAEGPRARDDQRAGSLLEDVLGAPCCRLASRTALAVAYLGELMTRRPLSDLRVRRAIDLALDRRELVERLLRGQGSAVGQLVSPQVFGYGSDIEPIERNVEEA